MRPLREPDLRIKGLGLRGRFVLAMTVALAPVMVGAGFLIYEGVLKILANFEQDVLVSAVRFTQAPPPIEMATKGLELPNGVQMYPFHSTDGHSTDGRSTDGEAKDGGTLYRYGGTEPGSRSVELLAPAREGRVADDVLRTVSVVLLVVVLVGAAVALWVASQVTRPIHGLIQDVRHIAAGDLRYKVHSVGMGEVELLARAIDRMTEDLEQARAMEVELSVRERERELAAGVREALLPLATPLVANYDLGAAYLGAADFGGDFHDFVVRPDGRVGLLVCDVSGTGIPAALVGATARSYLRGELERSDDLLGAMKRVNRWLVGDVRRGMFVTALYALVDPALGQASVVSAGHKVPLLRFSASDGHLRTVHPDGIALGFDKGPVFDRRLQQVEILLEDGDRLLLTNSAPHAIRDAEGKELGEKAFYARVQKHSGLDTQAFLKQLRRDLEQWAGEGGLQRDVSLVTIARQA
jgi:serine phosphatase RsbU (regulator of sigma subunit)